MCLSLISTGDLVKDNVFAKIRVAVRAVLTMCSLDSIRPTTTDIKLQVWAYLSAEKLLLDSTHKFKLEILPSCLFGFIACSVSPKTA